MEKTVNILAVPIVSIRHVTDLAGDVFIVVQTHSMVNGVKKVNLLLYLSKWWQWHENKILNKLMFILKVMCKVHQFHRKNIYQLLESGFLNWLAKMYSFLTGPKLLKQNASTLNIWNIGFIVSVVINFIFIAGVCLLCRYNILIN